MEHLVTFKTSEGRDGTHTATSLDDALGFVERLRNTEEASGVRVYRMQEVPIEFRTYFKVEVKPDTVSQDADDAEEDAEPVSALVGADSVNGEGETVDAASRRLFQRG